MSDYGGVGRVWSVSGEGGGVEVFEFCGRGALGAGEGE